MAACVQRAPSGCGNSSVLGTNHEPGPQTTSAHTYTHPQLQPRHSSLLMARYICNSCYSSQTQAPAASRCTRGLPSSPKYFSSFLSKKGQAHQLEVLLTQPQESAGSSSASPAPCRTVSPGLGTAVPPVPVTMQGTLCSVWLWRVWEAGTKSSAVHQGALPAPKSSEGPGKDLFQEPSPNPGLLFARQSRSASAFRRVQLLINPPRVNKRQSHLTRH